MEELLLTAFPFGISIIIRDLSY